MSIAPFLRPDLDQAAEQLPLYITGTLAGGKPGDAYEGRLQIHNQIGACVVLSVTGDDLPVGGTVSIDGNEVVVAWPAYAEAAAPITNPGFEDGMAGWQGGAGWSTTTDNPIAGTRSAVFKDAPGSSILSSLSRYPVDAGDTIHASAAIRQGASSAGNAGAGVRLEFRDSAGALVGHKDGNMVMSASNNAVKPSTVTVTPGDRPAGTELVNIACHGLRKRQNREVWADTFAWDHAVAAAGINADATICITIQIRDGAGRTATWSGCVDVVSYTTRYVLTGVLGASNNDDFAVVTAEGWNSPALSDTGSGGLLNMMALDMDGRILIQAVSAGDYYFTVNQGASFVQPTGAAAAAGRPAKSDAYWLVGANDSVYRSTNGTSFTQFDLDGQSHTGVIAQGPLVYIPRGGLGARRSTNGGATLTNSATPSWGISGGNPFAFDPYSGLLYSFTCDTPTAVKFGVSSNLGLTWLEQSLPNAAAATFTAEILRTPTAIICLAVSGEIWVKPDFTGVWVKRGYTLPNLVNGAVADGARIIAVGNAGMVVESYDDFATYSAISHALGIGNIQRIASLNAVPPAPPAEQAFDLLNSTAGASMSNADKTLRANVSTAAGSFVSARARKPCDGLCYFSFNVAANTGSGEELAVGVNDASSNFTDPEFYTGMNTLGASAWPWAGNVYFNNAKIGTVGSLSSGSIEVAVNTANRRVWLRKNGGAWLGGGDPAAGTNPTATLTGSGAIYPAANIYVPGATTGRNVTLHTTAAETTGVVPAGFTPASWL